MSYVEQSAAGFGGGLNLRDKTDAVSEAEAIDCLNVSYTTRGAVEQRAGTDEFTASALTNRIDSMEPFYTTGGVTRLICGCGTRLETLNTSGTVVASGSLTGLTTGTWDFARFGSPNNERVYAGQGETTLRRWDESAFWTTVSNTPKAGALAVMPVSNRLVAGRFNTTTGGPTGAASTSSPSHVYFSDAGDPETWTSTNFIQFTPSDGEKVQAIVAWENLIYVFKETKYFVIYGESIDSGGDPIFDYHTVDTGIGCVAPKAVCVDDLGVYFLDRRGVYRATGQNPPVLLSDSVSPIFLGGSSDYYLGGELLHSQITNSAMWAGEDRIYLAFTTTGTTNNRTLVYDTVHGWWSLYDFAASSGAYLRISSQPELVYSLSTGNKDVMRHNSSLTNDAGAAITSRWRSGWQDFALPDRKRIRESKVWGTGRPFMGLATDFEKSLGGLFQLDMADEDAPTWNVGKWNTSTWGGSIPLLPDLRRRSAVGTAFSTYFQNSTLNVKWSVHRATHHVAGKQIPSRVSA